MTTNYKRARAHYTIEKSAEYPGKLLVKCDGLVIDDGVWDRAEAEGIIKEDIRFEDCEDFRSGGDEFE
jgi:hypothetical protein